MISLILVNDSLRTKTKKSIQQMHFFMKKKSFPVEKKVGVEAYFLNPRCSSNSWDETVAGGSFSPFHRPRVVSGRIFSLSLAKQLHVQDLNIAYNPKAIRIIPRQRRKSEMQRHVRKTNLNHLDRGEKCGANEI